MIADDLILLSKRQEPPQPTIDRQPCQEELPPLVRQGVELFNRRKYFECHEALEEAWNEEPRPLRVLYQGILQIGVACLHVQRKNWRGAMKVLTRGIPKVTRFAPHCMGLNLARLLADAEAIHQELLRLGPDWAGEFDEHLFPKLELSDKENTNASPNG
jgi:hypothetical protein